MTAENSKMTTAINWLGRQLSNHSNPLAYIDPLLGAIDPMLVRSVIPARVLAVHKEARDTKTFVLKPASHWSGFKPGQHLPVTVEVNGSRQTRTFSISSDPKSWKQNGWISLTIKRLPGGLVTNFMHDALKAGDVISLGEAFGDFLLPANPKPLLYIAGGSGITPVLSQLAALEQADYPAPVTLQYYVRTEQDIIGATLLYNLRQRWNNFELQIHITDSGDLLAASHLPDSASLETAHCYLCGPRGLMDLATGLLAGLNVSDKQISTTFFSAPQVALDTDELGGAVAFSKSGKSATSDGESSLLDVAESAGLKPKHGCRMGICHQCSCTKREGTVINRLTGKASGPGEETIQLCISVARGPVDVVI
ncbi:MAG: iron-sulfur cluster-binding domain-containing protein [Halomonadaceae bacterium]|nr:MAG: iron-sulfur cluster-binding domain-containing protein [Halomonadaceae bacterium]